MKLLGPVDCGIKQDGSGPGFLPTGAAVKILDLTGYFRDRRAVYQPLTLIVKDRRRLQMRHVRADGMPYDLQ